MRVYEVWFDGYYGSGLAIVTANSPKGAADVARAQGGWWADSQYGGEATTTKCLRKVQADGNPRVLTSHYYQE